MQASHGLAHPRVGRHNIAIGRSAPSNNAEPPTLSGTVHIARCPENDRRTFENNLRYEYLLENKRILEIRYVDDGLVFDWEAETTFPSEGSRDNPIVIDLEELQDISTSILESAHVASNAGDATSHTAQNDFLPEPSMDTNSDGGNYNSSDSTSAAESTSESESESKSDDDQNYQQRGQRHADMNKASSRPEKRHLPNTPTLKRAITTIDATHHGSGRNQAPANTTVTVPKVKHGKARRILLPEASQQSAVTVSMRGDLQFIHLGSKPCRLPHFSMPAKDGEQRKVEDAASLGDTIVMVFKNVGHEVSLVTLGEKAKMTDLRSRGHGNGIRTVAPMHSNGSIRFLTGGYDHAVKLWDIVENNGFYDSTIKLVMQNNAPVNSLAWRATAQEIVAAAGAKVYQKDINRRPDVTPVTMSNNVFQIHVHPQNANVVCLEVDHLDKQIQLYDVRVGGFNRRPASEFGYRDQSVSLARRSHYRRGATRHSYFSRGYHDGCTALWDFRRPNSIVVKFMAKREQAVWHTAFANFQTTKLLSFGENHVSIYDLSRCND